jgi:putative ABC transport system permease protein
MNLLRDLRHGLRILARNPSYAAAALGVAALGIGATSAVFTVVRAVLLQPLPYRDPGRLVLFRADAPGLTRHPGVTGAEFHALRARTDLFEDVAAVNGVNANLTDGDDMERVAGGSATDNFLPLLGVPPLAGRPLSARLDFGDQYVRSVVISYELWQRRWQGDQTIVGRHISVNNIDVEVVGIMPAGFRTYLGADADVSPRIDIWFANVVGATDRFRGPAVARLRPAVSLAAAQQAVDALIARPIHLTLVPLADDVVHDVRPALLAFGAAVGFVLLVACANLTNLLLARACARTRELAIRTAIGASRSQLIRQLTIESVVLAVIGGAAGLLVAQWAVDGLLKLAPPGLPRRETIAIDAAVALFAFATALVSSLIFGLVPAWHATRAELSAALKQDPAASRGAALTRGLLVASQLAFSLLLLVGAGLMARTFIGMREVPLGFKPANVLTMQLELSFRRFDTPAKRLAFYQRARDAVSSCPGVREMGMGTPVPLDGLPMYQRVSVGADAQEIQASMHVALPGYFDTMRIPVRAGHDFGPEDEAPGAPPHVIVDERLADQLWPGRSAIGQRVRLLPIRPSAEWAEVIGVVDHVQSTDLRHAGLPQIYESFSMRPYSVAFIVRTDGDPLALAGPLKRTIERLGPGRPVFAVRTLQSLVDDASADTRFALFVLGVFAVLAVILTAIGVYGVVAYATARRTREIAVRLALGADARQIVSLVLREGLGWTVAGLAAGALAARVLTRYLETLLFNVTATDAPTFAIVGVLLGVVALLATALPAIRAVRVDPMLALRTE